jgi:two-component system cell cycle sensor histidine kinase/response regulator CckA
MWRKDGTFFPVEYWSYPIRRDGEVIGAVVTFIDISERRRLAAQLYQAQKMDAIGTLAGGVAHDFNNLLLVIGAYAELMLDSLEPGNPLRTNVEEILGAARRAADLTRQLLAFSRKQMQTLQILDLNTVLQEISKMLPRLIGEDIQLVISPGEGLNKVKADPGQIEQIVMNLAANARDAMANGGSLTIETKNITLDEAYAHHHSVVPAGEYVLLVVSDSGDGISDEHLPHIFEPFYTTKGAG